MSYNFSLLRVVKYIPLLLDGLKLSIFIAIVSMLFGLLVGIFVALGLKSSNKIIRRIVNGYVEVFRNTPLLLQMYLIYFGLAQFNIQIPALIAAISSMSINAAAYNGVIFYAGINSIPVGQTDAGLALGMKNYQIFTFIILPQAFRIVMPPLTNQFISTFLFSSIAATISVRELMDRALTIGAETYRTIEIFIIAAVLYLIVSLILTFLSSRLEKKLNYNA